MEKKPRGWLKDLFCLSPILLWVAIYSYPYFFESLSQNYRQIQTYNLDSMVMLRAVENALSAPWLRLDFIEYGHFYFNISMLAARLYALALPLSEWTLFFILRLFSLLGGFCTIAITFLFARRYLGRLEAVFAATVMAFSPRFIEFSNEVKPDSWQIFFLMLSVYFVARAFEASPETAGKAKARPPLRADFGFVLAASAVAGAAFGTKYQGILLIPLLLLAAALVPPGAIGERFFARTTRLFMAAAILLGIGLVWLGRAANSHEVMLFLQPDGTGIAPFALYWAIQGGRIGCFLAGAACFGAVAAYILGVDFARFREWAAKPLIFVCTGLAFVAAFALTSPWLLYHLQFVPNLYQRSDIVSAGTWYGFRWLNMLFGIGGPEYPSYFLAPAIGALGILGSVLVLLAASRRAPRSAYLPFLFVLGFAAIYIAFLIAKVNFVTTLYLLPVVPPLALMAAFALHEIRIALPRWLDRRGAAIGAAVLTAMLLALQIWDGGSQLRQYPMLVTELSPANRNLGDWLARCVPADARMLAAAYSYVPPEIAFMAVNWGPDYRYLESNNPNIVTLNLDDAAKDAETLRADPRTGPSGRDRFYDAILRSGSWQPGPTFAPYRVYVKTSGSVVKPACR